MFDDILNPWSHINRVPTLGQLRDDPTSGGRIKIDPLEPEQEQGLLGKIGSAALGGLGYVGGALEKAFGGRAIRGALGGNYRDLLSVIPFSDTLGITDETQKVTGRDLLRQWGVADQEDTWGNFLGGLALDMGTDPGMFLSGLGGKAFTEGGKIAQKIGMLPATARGRVTQSLADVLKGATPEMMAAAETAAGGAGKLAAAMDSPLAGLIGAKIPFTSMEMPLLTGSSGATALDALGKVGSAASSVGKGAIAAHDWLSGVPYLGGVYKYATPVGWAGELGKAAPGALDATGRYMGALFNAKNLDAVTEIGQKAAQARTAEVLPYAAPKVEQALRYAEELANLGVKDADEFRMVVEGLKQHPVQRVNEIAGSLRGEYKAMLDEAQRLGIPVSEMFDPANLAMQYSPRQWSTVVEGGGNLGGSSTASVLRAFDPKIQTGRQAMLSGFNEGTVGINKMVADPLAHAAGGNVPGRAAYIRQQYLRDPSTIMKEQVAAGLLKAEDATPELLAQMQAAQIKQSTELAGFLDSLPSQFAESAAGTLRDAAGNPLVLKAFGHNPIDEFANYAQRFAQLRARGLASQDLIAENLINAAGQIPKGGVRLTDAVRAANLGEGTLTDILDRVNQGLASAGKGTLSGLEQAYLPAEAAAELARVAKPFGAPEAVSKIGSGLDWLTNLFKTHVTTYWPGFNIRNRLSGAAQNFAEAGMSPFGGSNTIASALVSGRAVPEMLELPGMRAALNAAGRPETPEEAAKQISRWFTAHGVQEGVRGAPRDIVTAAGDAIRVPRELDDIVNSMVGAQPKGYGDVLDILRGKQEGTSWTRPLDVAGVNTATDVFTPVVAGRAAGDIIENMNRLPLFIESLKEGYTPLEAAKRVMATQFQYGPETLSSFERTVMRRLAPFYSFSRQNIPRTIDRLLTNPGGLEGVMARISAASREKGFLPEYMGEGLAIPIGDQTPEGIQRYLNRIDLPADAAFDWFKGTGGDPIRNSIMGLVGQLNPLIKGPLEYAVGKQFYSGRELGDLYSMTGNQILDQALFNSPLARAATTFRQAIDPRKDWPVFLLNTLTGAKVTDVDIPKYQAIAEREYVKKMLQGNPAISQYQTLSVRPDQIGNLTPEQFQLVQLQRLLEKRARDMAKQQRVKVQ